jgi:tripartite-type tricarboxylate transporter receptor subunit TctC
VWFGIVGPAGMRSKIVRKLNAELNTIFVMNDVKRRFAE